MNLRTSASQQEMLRRAAELEDMSQQKIVAGILWPIMEEKYGHLLND